MAPDPNPNPNDRITDYSETQRIVLLIDLTPLLHLPNPTPFLTSLLSATKTLVSFLPLSSSLFSFKPFFSSLSPLLSSSKLHPLLPNPSLLSLSFNDSSSTLLSLSHTLNSFSNFDAHHVFDSLPASPRASCLAASMRQLLHEYGWDQAVENLMTGTLLNCNLSDNDDSSVVVRSNLVVLFSPVCRNLKGLCEFMNVGIDDECLGNVDSFCERFHGFFDSVNNAFVSRDIQFSWVDVRYESEGSDYKGEIGESELKFGLFESGIRSLGWGFCSTDSIVLGSALVPFGLIYPKIAISLKFFDCGKKIYAQLSLEILDVSGKPLECKCCDLELVNLNMSPRNRCDDVLFNSELGNSQTKGCELKKTFWKCFGDGITNFHIKAVQKYDECVNFLGHLSDPIIIREFLGDSKKDRRESSGEFFADRVLDMLEMELDEFVQRKSIPFWQIILSFLYREGYWAMVSLSNGNGDSHVGILKPFTVSSALIFIIDDGFYPPNMVHDFGGANAAEFISKVDVEICKSSVDLKHSTGFIDSQSGPSPSNKYDALGDGKRKKNKKNSGMLQDLTWRTFYKAAFEHSELDLGELYFATERKSSKKLKFLKCWMKQMKKYSSSSLVLQEKSKPHQDISIEIDSRLTKLHQESEQPISSSASIGENSLTEASRIQDEAALDFRSETCQAFFGNLSTKIQQGLESEGVDLGALAERLVNSSIFWLYPKPDVETTLESQTPAVKYDDSFGSICSTRLLLREPKDLVAKHKSNDPSNQASDSGSAVHIVREYELQILFRMEILRSEVGANIGKSMKQKFVKQICLLLETIQCHLEGGFFGDWSLDNYVGKIIKSRYSHTLGDVVHRIYKKMDLLLFADEDKSPNPLFNSEDSNQSWREKPESDDVGEKYRLNEPVSAEAESLQLPENDNGSPQGIKQEEHARKLMKAQERRERARRFASFTSWMPDLQRVWAPKQPKLMKSKSDPLRKLSKRKDHRRVSYDRVCETPMTGNKRSCQRGSSTDDEGYQDYESQLGGSVSKALFQDD